MELTEFKAMNQKQKLSLIAEMRRDVEAAIRKVHTSEEFIKPEITDYAAYHRVMRKEILTPTTDAAFDFAFKDISTQHRIWMQMLDRSFSDRQAAEAAERINAAIEKKVTENKVKRGGYREGAGRPAIGDRRTFGIVMPDDEWAKIDLLIDRSGAKPAEFMRDLLRQRIYAAERSRDQDEYGY